MTRPFVLIDETENLSEEQLDSLYQRIRSLQVEKFENLYMKELENAKPQAQVFLE